MSRLTVLGALAAAFAGGSRYGDMIAATSMGATVPGRKSRFTGIAKARRQAKQRRKARGHG